MKMAKGTLSTGGEARYSCLVYDKGMRIFKSFTMTWWQVGIFKVSMICFGIILGAYFAAFFLRWIVLITLLFAVPAVYLIRLWGSQ